MCRFPRHTQALAADLSICAAPLVVNVKRGLSGFTDMAPLVLYTAKLVKTGGGLPLY